MRDRQVQGDKVSKKRIFSGGGTIGAVSPLLAIKEEMDQQKVAANYLWVGTRKGIEADIVAKAGIPFKLDK